MATKTQLEGIHYLSPLQQGLLFHAVADSASDPYVVQVGFVLEGQLDTQCFQQAWSFVAERHAVLRSAFAWEGLDKPVQAVRADAVVPFATYDLSALAADARAAELASLLECDRARGFELTKAPLMRIALVRMRADQWYFIHTHHHLILDGWSFAVVLRETLLTYRALCAGEAPRLEPVRPFRDYLGWVARQREEQAERFWRAQLRGFSAPTPLPLQRSGATELGRFTHAESTLQVSAAQTQALAQYARASRVTLNTLVQGAWALVLHQHAGVDDVVFGSTVSGRPPDLDGSSDIVGLLINTLPVRSQLTRGEELGDWLRRLQDQNSEIRQFEWTPLSSVQRWSEVPNGRALFDSIVVFDSYPEDDGGASPDALKIRALPRDGELVDGVLFTAARNNYPVSLIVEPTEQLTLILAYSRHVLETAAAARLLEQCRTVLLALPRARVDQLSLLSDAEQRAAVDNARGRQQEAPAAPSVHAWFEAQVDASPEAVALVCEGTTLTYTELERRANQLAAGLRARGVGSDQRVLLCLERSADMVIGILGVLKAGAAYVPVDVKLPEQRLRALAADSGARIILTQTAFCHLFSELDPPSLCLDHADSPLAAESPQRVAAPCHPENLAYMIYTSGSTGTPKAVGVEHRQLLNYVSGIYAQLDLSHVRSMAYVSTVAADLGHTVLFGALCGGRCLHVITEQRAFDPDAVADYMHTHAIDALKIVPSHLAALLEAQHAEHVLPKRCLVLGGEATHPHLLARIRALAPACAVYNHYGPTETTVGALTTPVAAAPGALGHPLPNVACYVLTPGLALTARSAIGELYIGGSGVARGYHGAPDHTAGRFIPDPFSTTRGARMYRTGDRARVREDGAIEFLGRVDHQVKLRGFRIELGEIEACLRRLPHVSDAVVVVRELRLLAYVVAAAAAWDPNAVTDALREQLPDYMVPSAVVRLDALPLTQNGKVDRAALPDPAASARPQAQYVEARTAAETLLAEVWREVLGVARVGIHDNFFALGGDSIQSLQVIARARKRGLKLSPKLLFDHPTISAAAAAAAAQPVAASVPPSAEVLAPFALTGLPPSSLDELLGDRAWVEDAYPLSPMQEGMLFHTLLNPSTGMYLMQQHYTWHGTLDLELVTRAWQQVAMRHPILRTSFRWEGLARPLQVVQRELDFAQAVSLTDLRPLPAAEREAAVAAALHSELEQGLDLTRAPLMCLRVFQLQDREYHVVRSFHHILTDDWCFSLLMQECLDFYAAFRDGRSLQRPQPTPYRDYIAWLGKQDVAQAEAFWRAELRGFSAATSLGVEQPALARRTRSQGVDDVFMELSEADSAALLALSQAQHLTPNTVLQGAWALLLSRYSGQRDVVFGVTVAGRPSDLPGVETIVGLFINSLPLRVQVPIAMPVVTWLQELLAKNYRIRQHEHPPLVSIQGWSELPPSQPLFHSLVVFENAPQDPNLGEQVQEATLAFEQDRVHTNYPLTVVAYPGERVGVRLSYDRQWFERSDMERMLRHLRGLLVSMVRAPEQRVHALSVVTPEERAQLLDGTKTPPLSAEGSYIEVFERQVRATPRAVAVSCQGKSLTYAQLDAAAERVCQALLAEGVGPESIVAVLERRSLELAIAGLGVLKAAGVYMPLDPEHPEPRLHALLAQSGAQVVWTSAALAPRVRAAPSAPRILVHEQVRETHAPHHASRQRVKPGNLAYVIFTSGSTGVPKAAMVEHAGMLNNVWGKVPALALGPSDVVAQTASQCFDISVWQLLSALLAGGRVHVIADDVVADPERLLSELEAEAVTVLEVVPSLLQALLSVDSQANRLPALRWLLPTGEAVSAELCRRWFALHPGVPLMNAYGPAECADDVATYTLRSAPEADAVGVPIGVAVPNVRLYVTHGEDLAPLGVRGELCVGGVGVGRGYLNDPVRTAQVFVPDPFASEAGARMYRTGDVVRRNDRGELEFIGRVDHQVKVRGFRIEPAEIEARLRTHSAVHEALLVVREDAPGDKRLVAYVVPRAAAEPSGEDLRAHLREVLPAYMTPQAFVCLPALPLTPNGKIDRRALPPPLSAAGSRPLIGRSPTEEIVASIWAEVLGKSVDPELSFFELGGHSLLVTQVVSRIRRAFAIELPLRTVFDHPFLAELASVIDQTQRNTEPARPALQRAPRTVPLPASFAQQRLWFMDKLHGQDGLTIPFALELSGSLDLAALRRALDSLLARHEVLRTVFTERDGEPYQVIRAPHSFELSVEDVSQAQLAQRIAACCAQTIDLQRGPVWHTRLLRLGATEHVLVVVLHHIAADGWSLSILVRDLMAAYTGAAPAEPSFDYADYAQWQRAYMTEAWRQRELAHWRSVLSGAAPLLDLPRLQRDASLSRTVGRVQDVLDASLLHQLQKRAEQQGSTLFMLLHAALCVLLHQQTGRSDIVVGTDVANRQQRESEDIVGFFINQLVLRCQLSADASLPALVQACRRVALDAYQHQDFPFDSLVADLSPERLSDRAPLFQIKLVLQNAPERELELPGLVVRERELGARDVEVDLLINLQAADSGLFLTLDYRADLYTTDYVEELRVLFGSCLEAIASAEPASVGDLVEQLRTRQRSLERERREQWRGSAPSQRPELTLATRRSVRAAKET
jgi:amino acid adenylation domain-containing protein